jgi:hypothetical protein
VTYWLFFQPHAVRATAQQPELKPALPCWADVKHQAQTARKVMVGGLHGSQQLRLGPSAHVQL